MMRHSKVTNRELENYSRVKEMDTDTKDKQEYMRIIEKKAIEELVENHQLKN